MTQKLDKLQALLLATLGEDIQTLVRERGEITLTVSASRYLDLATRLRDEPVLKFEQTSTCVAWTTPTTKTLAVKVCAIASSRTCCR